MWTDEARERYKDDGRRYPGDLTDAEWHTVEPVLHSYATLKFDLREMINACLYLEKAGCPWRFLPKEFGAWQTVRTWHDRFHADGIWRGESLSRRRPSLTAKAFRVGHQASRTDVFAGFRAGNPGHGGQHARHAAGDRAAVACGPRRLVCRARQGRWHLCQPTNGAGRDGPRRGCPGHDPRARREGLQAVAAALADRGHVRHAEQSLAPPHPKPGAKPGSSRLAELYGDLKSGVKAGGRPSYLNSL